MQRVKRSTAVAVMPAPPAGGTAGYFAKPDPTNGVPATVPGYEWHNMIQEELVGLALAAGLVLSDTDTTQLVQAIIKKGMQAGIFSYAVDTGAANTYQVAYSPAITALTDGMVLRFKAKTANTGASTFNPNGLGASPIWGADHAALGGGEIIANGDVCAQWNSSLNGGSGAWVLIDSTGGYGKSPTPALRDKSQKLATTEFIGRLGIGMDLSTANPFSGDMNALVEPGEYYFKNTATNTPSAFGLVKVWRETSDVVYQLAQESNRGIVFSRKLTAGTWSAWAEAIVLDTLSRGGATSATSGSTTSLSTSISFTAPRAGRLYLWTNGYCAANTNGLSISTSGVTTVATNSNTSATIGVATLVATVTGGAAVSATATVTSGSSGAANIILNYLFLPT